MPIKKRIDKKRLDRNSAGYKKKLQKLDKTIFRRIIILASIILVTFAAILIRLVQVQVFSSADYKEKTEDYTSIKQYTSAPRGQIYDRNGNVLAQTVVSHNIVYSSPPNMSVDDYKLYANRVANVFDVDLDNFSYHDKQDAYITAMSWLDEDNPKYNAMHLLTDQEKKEYRSGKWGDNASSILYAKQIAAIGDEQLAELSDEEMKMALIYTRMLAYLSTGQENVILEDASDEDIAYLVEHKTEFPGFDVDFGGWKRVYPNGEMLKDVIGSVSTTSEGLPVDYQQEYLAKGYQHNASVGKSGLELEYNDLLSGTQEIAKITYDSKGNAHKEVLQQAKKGFDIVLSIDMELQKTADEVVKTTLEQYAGTERRTKFTTLFFGMEDPNTGEILCLSGYQIDPKTRDTTYFASGNYVSLVNPGSVVKGATVYMGLSEGAITKNETIRDEPMNIAGQIFRSFSDTNGDVDAVKALSVSSNIYMFQVTLRLANATYKEGQPLTIPDTIGTFNKMRSYYSMFGLGSLTGLDVPNESSGYMGVVTEPGMLLNYSIGQFDMYTTIQLLQYVSVIASNGDMYKPHLYTYAKEVNSDEIVDVNAPYLKSSLPEENAANLQTVREGFRACVVDGNCYEQFKTMDMAAKTGTAEVGEWTTANFIGYYPSENAQVSFACSAPESSINDQDVASNICAHVVTPAILNKYIELYDK